MEKKYEGAIDPNEITPEESLDKYATIKVGPNMWCGEWRPRANPLTVPPIPDLGEYPEPIPPE